MAFKKILFLCTGNYYRSRFSEHLFNELAQQKGLDWLADSRGLAIERGFNNTGPISPHTLKGLNQRGLSISPNERFPMQVVASDFQAADKIIALDEEEHYPLMVERFSKWTHCVEYWTIHDIDQTFPPFALKQLEQKIDQLVNSLLS